MRISLFAAAGVATALTLPSAVQAQVRYAPGTGSYRVESSATQVQEAMGQRNELEVSTLQVISVTMAARTADSLAVSLRVDSSSATTTAPISLDEVAQIRGLTVEGMMSPQGRFYRVNTPSDTSAILASAAEGLSQFLIPLMPNARVGSRWSDTTITTAERSGIEVVTRAIARSHVLGDTTVSGQRAFRIQRDVEIQMSGAGTAEGQSLMIEGSGTINGLYVISAAGQYLSSRATQSMKNVVTVPAAGLSIPITQTSETRVERVGG